MGLDIKDIAERIKADWDDMGKLLPTGCIK